MTRANKNSLGIPHKARTPEYQREWRRLHPKTYTDAQKKAKNDYSLHKRYGITREEYNQWAKIQNYSCAICGAHEDEGTKRLAVDHDHMTGLIRGLLCHYCNRALGLFKDNPKLLREAADYLEKNGTTTIQD